MRKTRWWGFALATLLGTVLMPATPAGAQHGPTSDHLIGTGAYGNIEFVGREDLTDTPGLVADVAVSPDGNWAFLANWGEPDCAGPEVGGQNTPDAGAWVVDISDPTDPVEVGFIPSHQDTRPGEGMQVVHITTKWFNGDMLVMNNEQCLGGKNGKGGVSLFDVTNPLKPNKLSEHFGDFAGISPGDANDIHSAFAWDTGDKAYLVMTDNFEATDIDILDITNPKRPRLINELNLNVDFSGAVLQSSPANLVEVFLHDTVVKNIGGTWTMLLSYWDGGYVQLDVDDPLNPTLIGDTDYAAIDPELLESAGISAPPEGNGHQNEFTMDNGFFIGTDEDFAAHNVDTFSITTGPNAGTYVAGSFGWTRPIADLADGVLNGPTVFGGYGCPAGDAGLIPDPSVLGALAAGEEAILVLSRGPVGDPSAPFEACFFSEKVEAAQDAGYDAVIIANHHAGSGFGASPDGTLCGSKGHDFVVTIPGICLGHRAFHVLFNTAENYTSYPEAPAIGALGEDVNATGIFDGWGYVHLFDNELVGGKFAELDTYAIDEAHETAHAFGSGDLTVHEVATDPQDASFAYLSYYAGGLRSLEIVGGTDLAEVGGYLDPNGNNFWGVEAFVGDDGCTYILGSDRDDGLWIFKNTDTCP